MNEYILKVSSLLKSRLGVFALAVLGMAIPANAYALDMEYFTYNGFGPITGAFQKIALIFSDNGYNALVFTVIVLGILFGGAAVYYRAFQGARVSLLGWAWPVGLGVILYLALIIPKGSLTVYDTVLNRFQTIGNIPNGIVALAGMLNKIEKGIVDIVYTSGAPESYMDSAGGIGFDVLLKSTSTPLKLPDQYVDESLRRYTYDCLIFEFMRPGTNLSINDLTSNTTDFLTILSQAQNPAVFTVWYDESNKTGQSMSCTDAWGNLSSYLSNPTNYDAMVEAVCANAGFNTGNAAELMRCRNMVSDYVTFTTGYTIPAANFLRQAYIAQTLNDVILDAHPDLALRAVASRNIMTSGIGMGVTANEWLPVVRAIVTAVAVGMIPFFVIFIPTPVAGRAIGIIVGFFVWLTAWGVTDALTHSIATDYAYNVFEYIRQNDLGFTSMMLFPDAALKALGMFGYIRTSGIMLATLFSMMLVKFGGHALAIFAGNISGTMQSHGARAAMQTQTPEGQAGALSSLESAPPVMANAYKYRFEERVTAKSNLAAGRIGSGMGYESMDDAYAVGRINTEAGAGRAYAAEGLANEYGDSSVRGWQKQLSTWGGMNEYMKYHAMDELTTRHGMDLGEFMKARHQTFSGNVDKDMAQKLGLKDGPGRYSFTWDGESRVMYAEGSSGSKFMLYDFKGSLEGREDVYKDFGQVTEGQSVDTFYNSRQLLGLADWMDKQGHHHAAGGVRKIGLKLSDTDESARVQIQGSKDGRWATVKVSHGDSVVHEDMYNRDWRTAVREGQSFIREDVAVDQFRRGPQIDPQTMLNAVITKDSALPSRITGAATVAAREREEVRQAENLSKALSGMISKRGRIVSFSEVDGKGVLRIGTPGEGLLGLGASGSASVGLGRRNNEEQNYDLYYGMIRRIQSDAREKATIDGKFDRNKYEALYLQGLNSLYKGTDSLSQGKTEFTFGASGIIGEPWEEAKAMLKKVRNRDRKD